jgi:DNA adenine methylase
MPADQINMPNAKLPASREVLSPLRYPGGKRRLVPFIAATLAANGLKPGLLAEPFAGGASVALELAATDVVERIALGDLDPNVADFWRVAFEDCDWLCGQVSSIEVNLKTWKRFKTEEQRSARDRALACLFLNRTSFNGALHDHAGPIGGQAQTSAYDLACRFPRERLIKRLRACEQLAGAGKVVFVTADDAVNVLALARTRAKRNNWSLFYYLDPPFWAKSNRLYQFSFTSSDHKKLAQALRYVQEPWLLSYDVADQIKKLYEPHHALQQTVELLYTASQRAAYEELVVTNLPTLPSDTRLWRTKDEWATLRASRRKNTGAAEA